MRKYIAGMAAAAVAAALASSASAALHLQQPVTVRYGSSVVLHGLAPGGSPVTLVGASGGKAAQALLSTEANPAGTFHFEVKPTKSASYVAQSDFGSARVTVSVMPRIGLRRNGTVRVAPVSRFAGKPVVLQQLVGGRWLTVSTAEFGGNGVAHVAHWTPGQTLRAYVPAIGHGFVAGTSKILTADGGLILR
jgi:hypothetical protein